MPSKNRKSQNLNVRMSIKGRVLLESLTEHHGISQGALVEMLLRKEAREALSKPGGQSFEALLSDAEKS